MSKTRLSVITASVLAATSIGVFWTRWNTLGQDIYGPPAASTWKVTLVVNGTLTSRNSSVVTVRPPDFRHQHIFDETYQSKELLLPKTKGSSRPELVWRRPGMAAGTQPFRVSYSFRCMLGMRHPTAAMREHTANVDAAPAPGAALKPTRHIESDAKEIFAKAHELAPETASPALDQVQAFFDFVQKLDDEPAFDSRGALECLREGGGDAGAKSRLLVALCRNRGIPARLVTGLILGSDRGPNLHRWAEAWLPAYHQWWPMCPAFNHFGPRKFPKNYLVLQVGEDDTVRAPGGQFRYGFVFQDLHDPYGREEMPPPTDLERFFQNLSLYNLRPSDRQLVKFLLLLPLSALIVSVSRTVVGISTFGTFSPALLGLAFLDPNARPWGFGIFVGVVLVGWGMRHMLERYHLLQVPRISAMLTLIVAFLILVIVLANQYGVTATNYIKLFPLVILTHLVERFWTVEAEDGTAASFKTLLGTLAVSFVISLALSPQPVATWMFQHPETLGLVFAAQLLLGRYTGYRLSELYRFRDLLHDEVNGGGRP
jgi:transglutaminase-like putative cysteine protease